MAAGEEVKVEEESTGSAIVFGFVGLIDSDAERAGSFSGWEVIVGVKRIFSMASEWTTTGKKL